MVETTKLTKRYGQTVALDSLDLSISDGTIYGFLGPNGAGKTTTLRLLTGLTRPTSGTASIDGVSISDRTAVTRRIGYLPETPSLYRDLTVSEQLDLATDLRDVPEARATERVHSLLERFDLRDDADTRIADLSNGMRRKTGFVQAILHDPSVVLLDEPTAGLDPRAARTLRETLVELAEDRVTVFLSTHLLSTVEDLVDTIGVLDDGRLVAEGTPSELINGVETGDPRTLEDAFLELTSADPTAVSGE